MKDRLRLLVILGPTASGKSSLGINLAASLGGEILVCDSTQVYRHFDVGTAKVPLAEQRGIPHHLIDLVEPGELFTAGEYRRRALGVLEELRGRGKMPVVTAGTGLYLRALLEGLSDAPERSDELRERLRKSIEVRGPDHLHKTLARLDREAAERIAPRDTQKIIRAIEIRVLARKPVGEIHRSGRNPLEGYDICKIGLAPAREDLYSRIDARVKEMIAAGWVDEVRDLIIKGVSAEAKPFQFIGYSELRQFMEGRIDESTAIRQIQQATRRFAKRQLTWFRRETSVNWLPGFGDEPAVISSAFEIAKRESC
jgi:tRNA dimethylallyltransferase